MKVIDWGIRKYSDALAAQRELFERRVSGEVENTLVLTEHPAVFTIGKQGSSENILVGKDKLRKENIEVLTVERGGDITYHGLGQMVAYPVFKLPEGHRDVKDFIRKIEDSIVQTCREFDANAVTIEGLTGVWVSESSPINSHKFRLPKWNDEKKICSIGLAFKKWTSYHGVALNVSCDLTPFSYMHLCGLKGKKATSLEEATGEKIYMEKVKEVFINKFKNNWEKFINE